MATKKTIGIIFAGLIALQFLIIAAHDWINVPGWVTLINIAFPGTALAYTIWFFRLPKPAFVLNYCFWPRCFSRLFFDSRPLKKTRPVAPKLIYADPVGRS